MSDDLLVQVRIGFVNLAEIGHARPTSIIKSFAGKLSGLGIAGNDMKMDI
ncbi:MAG: hypothetical protein IT526_05410, partial [Nitrosomonas sp.]|nr:hypothetical protein [Nitrosomonas sp.]